MKFTVEIYKRLEIVLNSDKTYDNPFTDVDIDAVFTHESGKVITLPGFWNGANEWKVRFSAELAGKWTYVITCTDGGNASLTGSGEIDALPCKNPRNELEKHGYVRLEEGKRHMVYGDGTPFFYLADTHWMMPDYERLHECNYPGCTCGNQFKHVADDRIKKGFNVYQTYFASARTATTRGGTPSWWKDGKYECIEPEVFNSTMDIMIEYLAENGITTALGFGTHYATIRAFGNVSDALLRFVRYCVARYACYPLVWITAQEITSPMDNAFEIWREVGAAVDKLDGYHRPNGTHMHVHPATDPRVQKLDSCDWHQWWAVQGGHGGYNRLHHRSYYKSYYDLATGKPYIETENQYEDIYCAGFCGHDAPRIGAWLAVQSGSAGFTYGVVGLWAMSWEQKTEPAFTNYNRENWYQGVDKPGSEQVCYMKKFYEYVGWADLVPEFGFRYGMFDMRKHVAISHKDDDIIVYYFFDNDAETGHLSDLKKNVKYQARFFDTVTGKFIDLDPIITADGNAPIPAFPYQRDWVLLLNTYDLGEYETEPYPSFIKPIPACDAKLGREIPIRSLKVSSEDEVHPAKNLTDGDAETYWQGLAPKLSQTITADLGEISRVGYMHLECNMPDMRFIEYRVFGSNDGENWNMLVERVGAKVAVGGRFPKFYEPIEGEYRFVRFFLNSVPFESPVDTPLQLTRFAVFEKEN